MMSLVFFFDLKSEFYINFCQFCMWIMKVLKD